MSRIPDIKVTEEMYALYQEGHSLSQIGKIFSVSRQSVYERFHRQGKQLRPKKKLEVVEFNGSKYTIGKGGYYRKTDGGRTMMHRDVWEHYNGKIPHFHDVHHINEIRTDNRIENLAILSKADHTRLHGFKNNQHTIKKKICHA